MTHVKDVAALPGESASQEAVAWIRENAVTLGALAAIVVSLWVKGAVLAHSYFRQDDFAFFDRALGSHLGWHYLMRVYNGHLMPGSMAYVWVLARLDLYDWTLTSAVTILALALASLAMLRVLRTLLGNRPGVLVLLIVYLFTPILMPGLSFWSTTFQWVPTQLVIAMALNAHLSYLRTKRFWHAIVATAWLIAGLLFDDVVVLLPLLFLAITSAYLVPGQWWQATGRALREFWRGWLLYVVPMAGYAALFLAQLPHSGQELVKPGPFTNVLSFISTLGRVSLVPSALGGPWHWYSIGNLAFAIEVPFLTYLAWAVGAVIVGISVWYRRRSWRAWVILVGWVFLSAVVPLVAGRLGFGNPQIIGADLHYLADSAPVLAVCVGLAFWPAEGETAVYRGRPPATLRVAGTVAILVAFLAGSLWSTYTYQADTSGELARSYLDTARAAIAAAPPGSVIADTTTPPAIENAYYFGPYGYTSHLFGPLAKNLPNQNLRWTTVPTGVISNLLIFDPSGRLAHTAIDGRSASAPASAHGCWKVGYLPGQLPIPGSTPMYYWPWTLKLSYNGPAAVLAVGFGRHSYNVTLPAGRHSAYVRAYGSGRFIRVHLVSGGPSICVSHLAIGTIVPSYQLFPFPAEPVP